MKDKMFFIIGCQRSGTTFLHNLLDQHPEICMSKPIRPEPKFFTQNRKLSEIPFYIEKYFPQHEKYLFLGEKTTSYIEYEIALKQINEFFPDSKILIMLRNPIDRAISNYFYSRNNGIENREITEALFNIPIDTNFSSSVNPFDYLKRGHYSYYLNRVYSIFDKNRVKTIISEELFDSNNTYRNILDFIGVNSSIGVYNRYPQNSSFKEDIELDNIKVRLKEYFSNEFKILKQDFNIYSKKWDLEY